ncbi:hypothetical protein LTR62_000441 [Meristemomyces frigidus]|uniref:Ammonium transporter n=1 Tax=Meristemomyces frigidus TaxID=1508187 RepID=A0AAN7TNY1_9PEZI|nr:hypothetical protein LTR62_000441 [Meristemomyces frigidus]
MTQQLNSTPGAELNSLPYVPYLAYNGTKPTGGNSLTENLNVFYESGDIAWMLASTALVLLMIPGVGFFYSGLARRKSALSLIWLSVMAIAVTSVQWWLWGYSLTFSHKAGLFIGAMDNAGFHNVLGQPSVGSARIPDLMFAVYQGMFAAITVALAVGAVAERGRMLPAVVFMFVWSTLVYDPIACWTWNPSGWVYKLGGLDFAGGTPVHISSGSAALAYCYVMGKRTGYATQALNYRPHNVTHIVIGTVFLWVGWFGFNAGSALSANLRAIMAAVVTNLAACSSAITWCLIDYRLEGKWSTVGFCSGIVAGLVAITPGSGYVPAWAAVVFGVCSGIGCNLATQFKYRVRADDALDIFAVHGVGGLIGNLCTGLFAADYIAHLDGFTQIRGGWVNRHWIQLAIQLADSSAGMAYSFVVSLLILITISFLGRFIPSLRLRVTPEEEERGIDDVEIGEFAYDYVEIRREVKPRDPAHDVSRIFEEDEDEGASQRSHSQATMMNNAEKGGAREESYHMQMLNRDGTDPYSFHGGGIGTAS